MGGSCSTSQIPVRDIPAAPRVRSAAGCPWARCKMVLERVLNIPNVYLDSKGDKCYCPECYTGDPVYTRGCIKYVMPLDGCRFGLQLIDHDSRKVLGNDVQHVWRKWQNGYHGTKQEIVLPIIRYGFAIPGELTPIAEIKIRGGHIPEMNQFFSSPSYKYACDSAYATTFTCYGGQYKAIFQLRHQPGSYRVQRETLARRVKDLYIPQSEMEWVSEDTKNMCAIGLIIHEIAPLTADPPPLPVLAEEIIHQHAEALAVELRAFAPQVSDVLAQLQDYKAKLEEHLSGEREKLIESTNTNFLSMVGGILCCTPAWSIGLSIVGVSLAAKAIWLTRSTALENKEKKCKSIWTEAKEENYLNLWKQVGVFKDRLIVVVEQRGNILKSIEKKCDGKPEPIAGTSPRFWTVLGQGASQLCHYIVVTARAAGRLALQTSVQTGAVATAAASKAASLAKIESGFRICGRSLEVIMIGIDAFLICWSIYDYYKLDVRKTLPIVTGRFESLTAFTQESAKYLAIMTRANGEG